MNDNMSMTAEVSAFVRAYHTAEGGEICNDPLAVKLLGVGRFGQIAAQMTAGSGSCRGIPGHRRKRCGAS